MNKVRFLSQKQSFLQNAVSPKKRKLQRQLRANHGSVKVELALYGVVGLIVVALPFWIIHSWLFWIVILIGIVILIWQQLKQTDEDEQSSKRSKPTQKPKIIIFIR
jgi:Flp pilus assembly protein TadB